MVIKKQIQILFYILLLLRLESISYTQDNNSFSVFSSLGLSGQSNETGGAFGVGINGRSGLKFIVKSCVSWIPIHSLAIGLGGQYHYGKLRHQGFTTFLTLELGNLVEKRD